MKLKRSLLVGFLSCGLLFTACSNSPTSEGDPGEVTYADILKECGTKLLTLNNSKDSNSRIFNPKGFTPYDNPPSTVFAMPGIYVYWSGLLEEIEGVNFIDEAISFEGNFIFRGMGSNVQNIVFDLSVHFDEENNNFTFLGRQTVPAPYQYSYLILDCKYNFTTKELGDFTIMMQPAGFESGNYMRYVDGNLYHYVYASGDGHETDEDYITYSGIAQNGINRLNGLIETETVLQGDALDSAIQSFIDASDYCDEVCEGANFDAEVATE